MMLGMMGLNQALDDGVTLPETNPASEKPPENRHFLKPNRKPDRIPTSHFLGANMLVSGV